MARFTTDTQTDTSAIAPKVQDWLIVSMENPNLAWGAIMVVRGATGPEVRGIIRPEAWGAIKLDDVSTYDLGEVMSHPRLLPMDQEYLQEVYRKRTA